MLDARRIASTCRLSICCTANFEGERRVDSLAFAFPGAGERVDGVVVVVVLGDERRGAGHEVCVGLEFRLSGPFGPLG